MGEMVLYVPEIIDLDVDSGRTFYLDSSQEGVETVQLICMDYTDLRRMHVGFMAYSVRRNQPGAGKLWVRSSSLRAERLEPLRLLINALADTRANTLSASGTYERYAKFSSFIQWSDNKGYVDVLDSPGTFHRALIAYSFDLSEKAKELGKGNTINRYLTVAVSVADEIFPGNAYNFRAGVKFPGYSMAEREATYVPEEGRLFSLYRVADAVFREALLFLTDSHRDVRVAERYGERYWFFPAYYPLISETAIIENQKPGSAGAVLTAIRYNALSLVSEYNNTISLPQAIAAVVSKLTAGEKVPARPGASGEKSIGLPNVFSPEHISQIAVLAHDCFLFMFILNTSANLATAANILWEDASQLEAEVQRLRSIKRRAKNKSVEVVFGVRFLKRFREYLELRRFLPSAVGFKYLFGTFEHGAEPLQVNTRHAGNLSRMLRRLVNPSLPALGYRELRAYHLNTKSNEFGLQVALETAQHSEKTAVTSYMAGRQGATILEGVAYFSELSLAVESHRDTQAGSCAGNLISAVAIDDHSGGDPNCKEFIGCLFCKYYLLHLDAQDARKLLSMEYLIEQLRAIQYSEAEFCKAYGPTLARVRWLIELIENSSDELRREVSVLRGEVFGQECLTVYWQSKLNLLVDMGVL